MTDFQHRCQESDCIYVGQPTSPNTCKCHRSTDQMMQETINALVKALEEIVRVGGQDLCRGIAAEALAVVGSPAQREGK